MCLGLVEHCETLAIHSDNAGVRCTYCMLTAGPSPTDDCEGEKRVKRQLAVLSAIVAVFMVVSTYSMNADAALMSNLLTVCTSATTTTQASKCTAWQYNVYSPSDYLESYPQVSPGPMSLTDPAYEYRLGVTITPNMGVKICPTPLAPGTSFTSAAADPCPNNKLVSAWTVIPANSYAITTNPNGIIVYAVNASGVSEVPGSPFVPNSLNTPVGPIPPAPVLTAVDPSGQYLYALYNAENPVDYAYIYTYQMSNGVPSQKSVSVAGGGIAINPAPTTLIATAQHVYSDSTATYHTSPTVFVWTAANGVLSSAFTIQSPLNNDGFSEWGAPLGFAVDAQEHFLYWYWSSSGGTVADTVAIFDLNFATLSATLLQVAPTQGKVTLGAQ
jgi:hypothetical protein